MPLLLAITSAPGVGKSTLVRRVLERLDCKKGGCLIPGGLLTCERRIEGKRVGFELLDLATGETGTLATIEGSGPRFGRYRICLFDLENVGARAIERAVDDESDLIVIDEVGPMELFSNRFSKSVERALASGKTMFVVVQAKSKHPLALKIKSEAVLITVTENNRNFLADEIAAKIAANVTAFSARSS